MLEQLQAVYKERQELNQLAMAVMDPAPSSALHAHSHPVTEPQVRRR